MPRPKTDRAARALRLPRELDLLLVAEASRRGLSVSAAIEQAVVGWCAGLVPPVPQRRRSDEPIAPSRLPRRAANGGGMPPGFLNPDAADPREVSPRFRDPKAGRL